MGAAGVSILGENDAPGCIKHEHKWQHGAIGTKQRGGRTVIACGGGLLRRDVGKERDLECKGVEADDLVPDPGSCVYDRRAVAWRNLLPIAAGWSQHGIVGSPGCLVPHRFD